MTQPLAEDPDPHLAFWSEADPDAPFDTPPQPARQLVASAVDPAPTPLPSPPVDVLITRIDRLEQALADSKAEVSAAKAEQVALVRVVNDIRKQMTHRWSPSGRPIVTVGPQTSRVVSVVVGVLIGAVVIIAGWTYQGNDLDTIAASLPPEEAASPPVPTNATPTQPVPSPPPTAKSIASTPKSVSRPVTYVGTLSIDASPGGNVLVNRQPAGHTPLRLTNLRAGSHLIWIEREGHRRWTRVVQVPAERVTHLSVHLEPVAAR